MSILPRRTQLPPPVRRPGRARNSAALLATSPARGLRRIRCARRREETSGRRSWCRGPRRAECARRRIRMSEQSRRARRSRIDSSRVIASGIWEAEHPDKSKPAEGAARAGVAIPDSRCRTRYARVVVGKASARNERVWSKASHRIIARLLGPEQPEKIRAMACFEALLLRPPQPIETAPSFDASTRC